MNTALNAPAQLCYFGRRMPCPEVPYIPQLLQDAEARLTPLKIDLVAPYHAIPTPHHWRAK